MRKVIGIGESILDILFKDNQPFKAVPGGSVFNCLVSLGRCNVPACFISEIGDDRVGGIIKDFMGENNISYEYVDFFRDGSSPVALAFLDEHHNASYTFYKHFPEKRLDVDFPPVKENDVVVFGSYFALNTVLREKVQAFLAYAKENKAIIYYDINFRKAHAHESLKLMPAFIENFEYADIIRCSDEDLSNIYPGKSLDRIYDEHISFYTKNFIVTRGAEAVYLRTGSFQKQYDVPALTPASTIGAGDNFNAGLVYGMFTNDITLDRINEISESGWDRLISLAISFSGEVCCSYDNYISVSFGKNLVEGK